uniref:Uncharacterized protein n=1 Tax=Anguilla anguilla TaxID=7936 RepID=A0A0E9PDK6_ANGAN
MTLRYTVHLTNKNTLTEPIKSLC